MSEFTRRIWPFACERFLGDSGFSRWFFWPYFIKTWHLPAGRLFTVSITKDYAGWRWWWHLVPGFGADIALGACNGGGGVHSGRCHVFLRISKFFVFYSGKPS